MHRKKPSASSIAIALFLLSCALALAGCKPSSIRPSTPPTPPPTFNCDRTPPAPLLMHVPALLSAADLPAVDAWIRVTIAKYNALVITQRAEHACSATLRAKGVIR